MGAKERREKKACKEDVKNRREKKASSVRVSFSRLLFTSCLYASFSRLFFYRSDIHAEYVKYLSGRDTITAYLAYPERKDPAPAVVVIHEIFGMSDFIRQTTEQLAKDGFVAIAPDLLSHHGGTPASGDSARKLIAQLDTDTLTKDLDATVAYVKRLKAVRPDRVGVIGFCWGGGQDRKSTRLNS